MAGLHFDITGDNSNLLRKLEESRAGVRNTSKQVEESGMSIEQMFSRMTSAAAAFGAGFTAKELISDIIRVRGEFQQLEVAFKTMLGSEDKANVLMGQLVDTAAKTPFDLQGVANGAKQLLAYGTSAEDVNGTLVRLGDIAAGLSIPLGDLVYLYGTTMTQGRLFTNDLHQFQGRGIPLADELAKQFGVAKDKVGELVTAGKVGFPEVQKAIEAMTNDGGKFGGLMEAQSKTITGQISNIEDSISAAFNNIGKSSEGMINNALSGISYLIENYEEIGKQVLELAAAYGTYKAVIMSIAAYQGFASSVTYSAEIAELSKLIPLKKQSSNEDIQAAIASGKLTQSKAEQVIAIRSEIAAKLQSLQATEAQTKAEYANAMLNYKNATQRLLVAKQSMALAQSQMQIAISSGAVDEIAAAKKNAQTVSLELNNAAIAKNTAHKSLNIASTNKKTAADALSSFQTGVNTASQVANTTSTNILTVAKTRLTAASRALGLSMLANPYVLVTAAVVGLGYAVYKTATAETELDKAHKRLNETTSDVERKVVSETLKLSSLERKLSEAKKGTEEYNSIKKAIVSNYGQYYKGLDGEIERVGSLAGVYDKLVEKMRMSIGQRRFESFFKSEQENLDKTISEKLDKAYDTLIEKYGKDKGEKLYQQVFDSVIRGNQMPTTVWKQLSAATFKEWGFDNSPVGFSIRSVSSIVTDLDAATKASSKSLDEFKNKYQITEKEVANILSGGDSTQPSAESGNKALKQLLIDIDSSKAKIKELQNQANKGLISSDKIKEEQDVLSKLTADYKNRTNKEYGSTKEDDNVEKLRKQNDKIKGIREKNILDQIRYEEDLGMEVWQSYIDTMDEGGEKTLAQMELNHEKELQAIDRQKIDLLQKKKEEARVLFEANPANKGKSFSGSEISLSPTENQQFDNKYKLVLSKQSKERQAYYDREKQAMNEYLSYYGVYMQKRQAIIDQGENKKKGKNDWEQKSIDEETKKLLAGVDDEAQRKTSIITKLFSDMSTRTVADIRLIANEAKNMLDYVNDGEFKTDSNGVGLFGITKEQFDILSKSPEKLESIKNEIANVNREADAAEDALGKMSTGLKKVFSNSPVKFKEGLSDLSDGMNQLTQSGKFLSESLSSLGDSLGSGALNEIASGVDVAMDAMSSTMDGAKAGAAFGPWGAAAGAAIGMVTSLASSFAKIHDAKNEKRIQVLQGQIDALEKTYDTLGESIEKAYSKDASKLIAQQNTLLEQQKVLIRNQIAEEEQKKKSDSGRIEDWKKQIEDINKLIGENKVKLIDAIFGEDLKSSIENFAKAYADAWTANEDRAKSAKDTVKDMMRQMVTESIKAAIQSSKSMEQIRSKLQEFYADGVLSGLEQSYIYDMAEDIQKELDKQFGWADSLMKDTQSSQGATKGTFQGMSQDTGNELNGRFTAFQISNEEIKNAMLSTLVYIDLISVTVSNNSITLIEIKNLMVSSNSHLEDIAKYTKELIGFKAVISSIENSAKSMAGK